MSNDLKKIYVVCPKCTKLYQMAEIVANNGQRNFVKNCNNVPFPRARQPKTCARLAQKVVRNGNIKFYAVQTYCYKRIIDSLETLLKPPGPEEQREKWKTRQIDDDMYADVYSGNMWNHFGNWKVNNKPFLDLSRSFGLMINVD